MIVRAPSIACQEGSFVEWSGGGGGLPNVDATWQPSDHQASASSTKEMWL